MNLQTGEGNPELAAQIKDLTKKVEAREEKLKENERELDTLKEQVLQLRQLNDSIPILNEQVRKLNFHKIKNYYYIFPLHCF